MPFDLDRYHRRRLSRRIGVQIHYREQTASTMDDARAGAEAGGAASCGAAYVAGEQTAGRGRQGRSWLSAAAAGLYVTYHLCPSSSERAPLLSVAGGLAAAEAIEEVSGVRPDLKWPNDVLHGGRKLCGVLAEARHGAQRLDVFLGIGVNLRTQPGLPPEVAAIATSVEAAAGPGASAPAPEDLLAALSTSLERWSDQLESAPGMLLDAWRARLVTLGHRVRVLAPAGPVEGEAVAVTDHGELVLRFEDGSEQAFAAGDVHTLA
jgi:BirA family transcriptional regulator, biotin operon repressor / biotin---[acetyl-CoA-carboxylase] ligase